jgi:hypothetical protein
MPVLRGLLYGSNLICLACLEIAVNDMRHVGNVQCETFFFKYMPFTVHPPKTVSAGTDCTTVAS